MACRVLFFDLTPEEKLYFNNNKHDYFNIEFLETSLNSETINCLRDNDFENTIMISIRPSSNVTSEIISRFKNLRLIALRSQEYNFIDWRYCLNHNIAVINVETLSQNSVDYILKESFAGMTSFLCGGKDNRVV